MFLRDYLLIAVITSLTSVDAFSLTIRMPSMLSKGAGGGGGSGSGGGGGGHGGHHGGSGSHLSPSSSNSFAVTGRGSSGDTGHPAVVSFSGPGSNTRVSNYFSKGGGNPLILPSSSAFAGRKMGGGTREQIVGTSRYASGYPYSVSTSQYDTTRRGVYGQPFPFGFYPIYWGYHGYGGEYAGGEGHGVQYNLSVTAERPGGNLSYVYLVSKEVSANATFPTNNSVWMIGDYESLSTILSLLVDPHGMPYGCNAKNSTILPFITVGSDGGPLLPYDNLTSNNTNATNTTSSNSTLGHYNDTSLPFQFENVIQWYRASSFALVVRGYNNTYAFPPHNETTDPSNHTFSTPLSRTFTRYSFLRCVNRTIYSALPILDSEIGYPKADHRLSTPQIVGIVFGSVFGAFVLIAAGFMVWRKHTKGEQKKAYKAVAIGHERNSSDGPIVHDSERTMVEDDEPPAYSSKPLFHDAK